MPNSLYRMPLVYLFLACVFCYSCSFLFVVVFCVFVFFFCSWSLVDVPLTFFGGLSLSDESFPNEGARGAFAKPSRSLQEDSAKPSRSVSSRRLRGASKAQPRTLRGGLRTLRGGCTYRRLHEDALEGSRGLLEGSVNELRVPTRSWL